jgi:CubicO group peptidase (beta-lactamase class C family)
MNQSEATVTVRHFSGKHSWRNAALRLSLALVLCSATALTLSGQTPSLKHSPPLREASPKSVGMSAERLARIDAMCNQAIAEGQVPGIVALVARHGKIVYHKAFGMADNANGRVMKRDDIFRIASQSKAVTATAVMMLWEEGRFQLDDPISKYIPEFKNPKVLKTFNEKDGTYTTEPAKSEITIRQLMTHTSGIGYGAIDDDRFKRIYKDGGVTDLFTTEPVTIGESVRKLAKLPLHHQPGEHFTYSEGLDVMGYFIEVISGMTFEQFLQLRAVGHEGFRVLPSDRESGASRHRADAGEQGLGASAGHVL